MGLYTLDIIHLMIIIKYVNEEFNINNANFIRVLLLE